MSFAQMWAPLLDYLPQELTQLVMRGKWPCPPRINPEVFSFLLCYLILSYFSGLTRFDVSLLTIGVLRLLWLWLHKSTMCMYAEQYGASVYTVKVMGVPVENTDGNIFFYLCYWYYGKMYNFYLSWKPIKTFKKRILSNLLSDTFKAVFTASWTR